ncbi:MAG: gliding motility-associated C-terminal domain-containing protein [Flavobacteriales bacterium]|nr:gliding motility-associated C-terminal domain-containing protein [Flavobacteriales bacterium]
MKRLLLIAAVWMCSTSMFAQETSDQIKPLETPKTAEEIISSYSSFEEAVFEMTREEWAVVRAWDAYNEDEVVEIIMARKNTPEAQERRASAKAKRMNQPPGDGCECWIEPDGTYTNITTNMWDQTGGAGADVDAWLGPISLGPGVTFNLYGTTHNSFFINSKGTISFGAGYIDWTPEGFPEATYNQVAGYWADIDIREQGQILYKVTPEAVYVNFVDVDYFNSANPSHFPRSNSFQIIITPEGSDFLGENNVQLCYLDMGWAHGDVGGNGGFNGPNPGVNGADAAATNGPGVQFGRFNVNNANYDGPLGNQDGINWLDNKTFAFNVASATSNIPPISSVSPGCDTIRVCLNDTFPLNMNFLSPEIGQTTSIEVEATGDGLFINNIISGGTALLDAGFAGSNDNLGVHTITVTATDDGVPAGVTTLQFIVEVIPVEIPVMTITGDLDLCAGQTSVLLANEGFDEYLWSTGCETIDCEVGTSGLVTAQGFLSGCSAEASVQVTVTPFFLPPVTVLPNPVCSNDSALAYVPMPQAGTYVDFEWNGNYNNLGGVVYETNGADSAYVSPGTFQLLVTNEEGCQGQRIFNVGGADAAQLPEDIWSGAYCDGIEPVDFDGATGEENCGNFLIYMINANDGGWGDGFLTVSINGEDAGFILTSSNTLTIHDDIEICSGDFIEVFYISDGSSDANKSLQIFNCGNQNNTTINTIEPGLLWSGNAGCVNDPPSGVWSQIDGPAGTFAATDIFNTTFTPTEYGVYNLAFTDQACGIEYLYALEFNEEPELSISLDQELLCDGESVTGAVVDSFDPGGTGVLNWPNGGPTYGPYTTYQDLDLAASFTNGCGTAEANFTILAFAEPEPSLEGGVICDGSTFPLSAVDNPNDGLVYEWTLDGATVALNGNNVNVDESGTYCVLVSNECYPTGVQACAEVSVGVLLSEPVFDEFIIDCDGDGSASVCPQLPAGFTIEWPDGTSGVSGDCFETTANGSNFCVSVTDSGNCETTEHCGEIIIQVAPTVNGSADGVVVLCPEVENTFDLQANGGVYNWYFMCLDAIDPIIPLDIQSEQATVTSSMIPEDCWDGVVLIGEASNFCGSQQVEFPVSVEACEITIPNVFTPNGDGTNNAFVIEGLEVYDDVILEVWNRWGNLVYESTEYRSGDFTGRDLEDGTYFYALILPNGIEKTGTFTIMR